MHAAAAGTPNMHNQKQGRRQHCPAEAAHWTWDIILLSSDPPPTVLPTHPVTRQLGGGWRQHRPQGGVADVGGVRCGVG